MCVSLCLYVRVCVFLSVCVSVPVCSTIIREKGKEKGLGEGRFHPIYTISFKRGLGTSLVVQWLRIHLAMQGCGFDYWSGN